MISRERMKLFPPSQVSSCPHPRLTFSHLTSTYRHISNLINIATCAIDSYVSAEMLARDMRAITQQGAGRIPTYVERFEKQMRTHVCTVFEAMDALRHSVMILMTLAVHPTLK